jgi:drug/metabolite transporter (DMT)-like permease
LTLAAALFGAAAISFSAIFFALADVSPVTGAFYRTFYALPLLFLLWWLRRDADDRPAASRWIAVGAGVALGLDMVAWHSAIDNIGAGLATLLANSQVIFVAVAAWVLHKEKPSRQVLIAIPVILTGVAMVSGIGQQDAFGENPLLGTAFGLVAAMFYAVFLLGYRNSNTSHAPAAGPLLEATFGAMLISLVVGVIGPGIELAPTWPAHGWLLALALGAQVVGWLMIGYALPRLPAVETATIVLLQPVLTTVWGILIFGERPSSLQVMGAVVVLSGVSLVAVSRARAPAQPVEAS